MGDDRGKSHFLISTLQYGSLTMLYHHVDPKHSVTVRKQCIPYWGMLKTDGPLWQKVISEDFNLLV